MAPVKHKMKTHIESVRIPDSGDDNDDWLMYYSTNGINVEKWVASPIALFVTVLDANGKRHEVPVTAFAAHRRTISLRDVRDIGALMRYEIPRGWAPESFQRIGDTGRCPSCGAEWEQNGLEGPCRCPSRDECECECDEDEDEYTHPGSRRWVRNHGDYSDCIAHEDYDPRKCLGCVAPAGSEHEVGCVNHWKAKKSRR